jgi:integrase
MKNKKGTGSYKKLSNGTIEYTVSVGYTDSGKRERKKFYGRTENECRKKYREFIKEGEKPKEKTVEHTLSQWIAVWLTTYKQGRVEDSTYSDYSYLANHVENHDVGSMKLTAIKPIHVTGFFSDKSELSHSFHKRVKYLLTAAFEAALDNELCNRNPVRKAEAIKKVQPEKEAFTESEVREIIDFAKTDKLFGLPIYIMLNSGIRSGEMRVLTSRKFDFTSGVLTIDKAIKRTEEIGLPKNNKTRYIPICVEVAEFLKTKLQDESGYIVGGNSYVSRAGFRSRYQHFFNRLNKHLESNGKEPIPYKSPHAMRHSYGILCQKSGVPVGVVSAILGHASLETTDKYTHLSDISTLTEAIAKSPLQKILA